MYIMCKPLLVFYITTYLPGYLARDFITGDTTCEDYLNTISQDRTHYNLFHLIVMDLK